jgi:ABC-type transport system substrate-binding protein
MNILPFKMVLLLSAFLLVKGCQEKGPKATKSDSLTINLGVEPTTLHPFTYTDNYTQTVFRYVQDTLLNRDLTTNEWKPGMAESWEISADKKTFTFKLREGMKWHDGQAVTAEDVKFSFDEIFNPEINAAQMRPFYENIKGVEILDARTVRFFVKDAYFQNFDVVAELTVVPKHYYGDKARRKEHNKNLIGAGPYKVAQYEKGKRLVLEQNPDWWGRNDPERSKEWNIKRIVLRFIKEDNVELESFKKGDVDFIGMQPETYVKKTDGPQWGKSIHKVKTENKSPKGYTYIAWNLKNPILADRQVRRALAMLYPRDMVMEKFNFNLFLHADGPVYGMSDYHSPKLKAVGFDPQGALKLLKAQGWSDTDADGILDKTLGGKKTNFTITLLEPVEDQMKYVTVFKEEARKIGVDISIKAIEWNSFIKLIDERKFDAVRLAWGGGSVEIDLKQIWHSQSQKGGSNFISYSNPAVDKLIDQARVEYDRSKRIALVQKASELIAADDPYLFLFTPRYSLYGHSDRVRKTQDTYPYAIGQSFWTLAQ